MAWQRILKSVVIGLVASTAMAQEPMPTLTQAGKVQLRSIPRNITVVEAGNVVEAIDITQEREAFTTRMNLLKSKKEQFKQLQSEISDLERELNVASQFLVRCSMAEVSIDQLRQSDPEIQWDDQRLSLVDFVSNLREPQVIPAPQFKAIETVLNHSNAMKVLGSPALVVEANRAGSVHSGGEFPVVVPASGEKKQVDWREFGMKLEVRVEPLGANRVSLHIVSEHSERDFKNSVKVDGQVIPGLKSASLKFDANLRLGETILVSQFKPREKGNTTALLTAITVNAVAPLEPVAASPQLTPIPEPYGK